MGVGADVGSPQTLVNPNCSAANPGLGRLTQIDPLDQAGYLTEANRYGYVGDDPVNARGVRASR
jgi:hypothetical protein